MLVAQMPRSTTSGFTRVFDAHGDALLIRDLFSLYHPWDPGSATHRHALHRARDAALELGSTHAELSVGRVQRDSLFAFIHDNHNH